MGVRSGAYWEKVTFGSSVVSAQCAYSTYGSGTNYSPPVGAGAPGQTGSSACPTLPYKTETGATTYMKGQDLFNLRYSERDRTKKLRMCCT